MKEAVLDGKMPGDHLDELAFERCVLRRQARQVQRLAKESADPEPSHCAAWIIAPHVPDWLKERERKGTMELRAVAPSCIEIHPSHFPIVWVAANDLPLHEALIPRASAQVLEHHWIFACVNGCADAPFCARESTSSRRCRE